MTQAMVLDDRDAWLEDAVATIIGMAHTCFSFTADDLRREMRTPPHTNLPGIAFSKARALGYITSTGYEPSTARSRNGGGLRRWTVNTKREGIL